MRSQFASPENRPASISSTFDSGLSPDAELARRRGDPQDDDSDRLPAAGILHCIFLLAGALVLAGVGAAQERVPERELAQIVELLEIGAGARVADVGAGGGQWTRLLAGVVGKAGRVYASDVKPAQIEGLEILARSLPESNVTVIRGSELETGLPTACCEAILLRLVYHAFDNPRPMREGLLAALRPGGKTLVIDFRPPPPQLVAEMEESGFELLLQIDAWRGQEGVYAVLFGAPAG